MLYIYAKFHEIISNGIKVIDTISIGKITKGDNSAKNAGGATVGVWVKCVTCTRTRVGKPASGFYESLKSIYSSKINAVIRQK